MSYADDAREPVDEALSRLVCSGTLASSGIRARPIPDALVEAAVTVIDSTDICERIAKWRAEDRERAGKTPGGRPSSLSDRAVLVVLLLLALEHSPLFVSRMAETLACRLSDEAKARLGIDLAATTGVNSYNCTWRAVHSALSVIDPFPAPRNRLLTKLE